MVSKENADIQMWTVVSKERNVLVDVLNADPEIITDMHECINSATTVL